jgi:hypothetical protein
MRKVVGQSGNKRFAAPQSSFFRWKLPRPQGDADMLTPPKMLVAIVLFLALSGCDTLTTDNPIGTSDVAPGDGRLVGAWKLSAMQSKDPSAEGSAYAFFLPRKEGGFNAVLVGWKRDNSESDYYALKILTGQAGGSNFLNVVPIVEDGKVEEKMDGYWPVLYRIDGNGILQTYKCSDDGLKFVESAINDHHLGGTVTKHELYKAAKGGSSESTEIEITADQKSLDAFFTANASRIFTEPLYTFKRADLR